MYGLFRTIAFVALGISCVTASSAELYVGPSGDDGNAGTFDAPLATVAAAAGRLAPGDTLYLRGGQSHQPIVIDGLHGEEGKPITIRATPGERVVMDGTDALEAEWKRVTRDSPEGRLIQPALWERIGGNVLYSMILDEAIYSLVYDDVLMSNARWPTSNWDAPYRLDRYAVLRRANEKSKPGDLHDDFPTENALEESVQWLHYDRKRWSLNKESLADTGIDFTGSVVVISYAWTSFATRVTAHQARQGHFNFDTECRGSGDLQEEAVRYIVKRIEWDIRHEVSLLATRFAGSTLTARGWTAEGRGRNGMQQLATRALTAIARETCP